MTPKDPGPLVLSFWAKGNPVWGGQVRPESARSLAEWFETRSYTESGADDAGELRNVAKRLRAWASNYENANGDEPESFGTEEADR